MRGVDDGNTGQEPVPGLGRVDVTPLADMIAYDQLGPRTRAVIDKRMVVKWSAAATLAYIGRMGQDPQNPCVDAAMASILLAENGRIEARLRADRASP